MATTEPDKTRQLYSAPKNWATDQVQAGEESIVEGICAGIWLALDVIDHVSDMRNKQMPVSNVDIGDEWNALEYLARFAKWQEMGAMIPPVDIDWLLEREYGEGYKSHWDEISHYWTRY